MFIFVIIYIQRTKKNEDKMNFLSTFNCIHWGYQKVKHRNHKLYFQVTEIVYPQVKPWKRKQNVMSNKSHVEPT